MQEDTKSIVDVLNENKILRELLRNVLEQGTHAEYFSGIGSFIEVTDAYNAALSFLEKTK